LECTEQASAGKRAVWMPAAISRRTIARRMIDTTLRSRVDRRPCSAAGPASRPSFLARHARSPTPNTRLCFERLQLSPLSREEHETLDPHRCCPLRRPGRLRQGRAAEAGSSRTGTRCRSRAGTDAGPRPRPRRSPGRSPGRQRPGDGFPVGSTRSRPGPDARRGRSQGCTEEVTPANPGLRGASKKPASGLVFSLASSSHGRRRARLTHALR
jgi:hypothetical protein